MFPEWRANKFPLIVIHIILVWQFGIERETQAVAASKSQDLGSAAYDIPEVYHLGTPNDFVVHVDSYAGTQPIRIDWKDVTGSHSQFLETPPIEKNEVDPEQPTMWWPSRDDADANRPHGLIWAHQAKPTIIIVCERPSGVYDVRAPIVFELNEHKWKCISTNPNKLEFTDRGSFYISGLKLFVIDFVCDWNYSHGAPQKYCLKEFQIRKGHIFLVSLRKTRRRYSGDEAGLHVPSDKDPLREFGLKWRWWGGSSSLGKIAK